MTLAPVPSERSFPPGGAAGTGPRGPAGTHPAGRAQSRSRPGITDLASGFVGLFLEVEAGRRPRAHLAGVMSPMLYARLSNVWVRGGSPGSVMGVRVTGSGPAGVDLVALVRRGRRRGAIALHMTVTARGWMVDDIALPEHGPLPLPPYPVPAGVDDEDDDLALVPSPVARPTAARADARDRSDARGPGVACTAMRAWEPTSLRRWEPQSSPTSPAPSPAGCAAEPR